jgi:hypothetical protein
MVLSFVNRFGKFPAAIDTVSTPQKTIKMFGEAISGKYDARLSQGQKIGVADSYSSGQEA